MVPYLHFELVIVGNDLTDKQKMTDKSNLRVKITDKAIYQNI